MYKQSLLKILNVVSYIAFGILIILFVGAYLMDHNKIDGNNCRDKVTRKTNLSIAYEKPLFFIDITKVGFEAVTQSRVGADGEKQFRLITNFLPEEKAPYMLWREDNGEYYLVDELQKLDIGVWQAVYDACEYWNVNEDLVITTGIVPPVFLNEKGDLKEGQIILRGSY